MKVEGLKDGGWLYTEKDTGDQNGNSKEEGVVIAK